jgi:four helix bundle protein
MESGNIIDLKTKAFAVRIIKFAQFLQEQKREFILSKQILRSGTSIGANTRERKNAASKADFINKFAIALKEADESLYWLELLVETDYITESEFDSLSADLKEICALLASSIKTIKNNL